MRVHNPIVIIPWFDSEGMKQRSHMTFTGVVDRRRIHREVRRFIQKNFGTPSTKFVKELVLANMRAFQGLSKVSTAKTVPDTLIEDWIQRIQDDPDSDTTEEQSDQGSEGSLPKEAELDMPSVSEGSTEHRVQEHLLGS